MRIDATISFEIKDSRNGKDIERHVLDATPLSVQDVVVQALHSGLWTGQHAGSGTFYPASRLYSARARYRSHCGHDECTKPYGMEYASHASAADETREHVHTLPKPKPAPKKEKVKDEEPQGK